MYKRLIAISSALLFIMSGCVSHYNDEIILTHLANGSNPVGASSKKIFSSIMTEMEDNATKAVEDRNFDSLSKYMESGDFLTLTAGDRIRILQIDEEYARFLVLEGRYTGKKLWTYVKYLDME